jgi:8-amino-7-oxononanoate synthase
MLDFTSSLYLGLKHESRSIEPWDELTTGAPAALLEPPGAEAVGQALAGSLGCRRGVLRASTLHLFWDVFGALGGWPVRIYWDAGLYPIARWGVERAAAQGTVARQFAHHDVEELRWHLRNDAHATDRPVVVTDGFCPGCGRAAPLRGYLESARAQRGLLVLDDTQALGVLGRPSGGHPYGRGGGGSLPHTGLSGPDILVGGSLAKAFGVPVAVLAGHDDMIRDLQALSETRVHCSPPSAPVIHASRHALMINARHGDELRQRLAQRVSHFRRALGRAGFSVRGGLFPVQRVVGSAQDAVTVHRRLRDAGVRAVLQRPRCSGEAALTFVITARHSLQALDQTVQSLVEASATTGSFRGRRLAAADAYEVDR